MCVISAMPSVRQQVIIWTNVSPCGWRIYASINRYEINPAWQFDNNLTLFVTEK